MCHGARSGSTLAPYCTRGLPADSLHAPQQEAPEKTRGRKRKVLYPEKNGICYLHIPLAAVSPTTLHCETAAALILFDFSSSLKASVTHSNCHRLLRESCCNTVCTCLWKVLRDTAIVQKGYTLSLLRKAVS